MQRRPGKALSEYCLGLDPDLHLRWQAGVQGGALEVSVCVVFSGPQDREPASKLVFLGKAADLKAYLESQELANRNGRGSDFAGANRCDTAPPDKAAGPTFPTPPQAGLTMGAVKAVFFRLVVPDDRSKILVQDLPQALEELGVPPVSAEVYDRIRQQVPDEALGFADFVSFLQSVTSS